MELIKSLENFNLNDVNDYGWKLRGNVTEDNEGAISITAVVTIEPGEVIGNITYYKSSANRINFNLEILNSDLDSFLAYANSTVDFVLSQF